MCWKLRNSRLLGCIGFGERVRVVRDEVTPEMTDVDEMKTQLFFLLFGFDHLFGYSRSKLKNFIQIQSIVDSYFFLREYYGSFNGYFTLLPPINFLSQLGIDKVHAGDQI